MSKFLTRFTRSMLLAGVCAGLAASAAAQTGAKISDLHLRVSRDKFPDPGSPCGASFKVEALYTISGPGKVLYKFMGPDGANFAGGPESDLTIGSAASAAAGNEIGLTVTFSKDTKGQFRAELAVQSPDGHHGPVTLSNIVPFDFKCSGGGTARASQANQPSGEALKAGKATQQQCEEYANSGVAQNKRHDELGCPEGPQWNPKEDPNRLHEMLVKWCTGAQIKAVQNETARRANALRDCEKTHKGKGPVTKGKGGPAKSACQECALVQQGLG
jgi:hypothetical protein